jgi:hypothetical protein
MTLVSIAAGAFCALATLLHIASIAVVVARVRRPMHPSAILARDECISIVRPLCGIENFTESTLASSFGLACRRYEVLFCVAQPNDPVIPVVQRLIDKHPEVPARLLVGNDRISDNPKLNNVVKGWNAASYAWIVMSDSNVLMPADYLQELFGTWAADTGVVSSPAIGSDPDGFWAELECAFLNTYQARWQCFADDIGMGFAQGKTMLYRRDLIEAAGGIRALGAELAEDAASTKIVPPAGLARARGQPPVRSTARPADRRRGVAAANPLGAAAARHLPAVLPARAVRRMRSAAGGLDASGRHERMAADARTPGIRRTLVRRRSVVGRRGRLAIVAAFGVRVVDAGRIAAGVVVRELAGERLHVARQPDAHRRPRLHRLARWITHRSQQHLGEST